jgi:hypothetical protein
MQIAPFFNNLFSLFRRSPAMGEPTARVTTDQRKGDLAARYAAYSGIFPQQLKATKQDIYAQDNISEPIARQIVDIQSAFLMGKGVSFSTEQARHQTYINEVLKANDFDRLLREIALSGHVSGDVIVKLIPAASESDFPRVVVLDPRAVEVSTASDDLETITEWRITREGEDDGGRKVYLRQRINLEAEIWVVRDEESTDNKNWIVVGEEPFPAPFCPIIHCQHLHKDRSFWGSSELEPDILKAIAEINFLSSSIKRIARLYAHPLLYSSGILQGQEIDFSPGKLPMLPVGGKIESVQTHADIPTLQIEREKQKEALFEALQIPAVVTGRVTDLGATPGIAIRLMYGPMVAKNAVKQANYGQLLERMASGLLALGGYGFGIAVIVSWPDPLPANDRERIEVVREQLAMGILSRHTAAEQFGLDYDEEAALIASETPREVVTSPPAPISSSDSQN